jgi:hypothetical protein
MISRTLTEPATIGTLAALGTSFLALPLLNKVLPEATEEDFRYVRQKTGATIKRIKTKGGGYVLDNHTIYVPKDRTAKFLLYHEGGHAEDSPIKVPLQKAYGWARVFGPALAMVGQFTGNKNLSRLALLAYSPVLLEEARANLNAAKNLKETGNLNLLNLLGLAASFGSYAGLATAFANSYKLSPFRDFGVK